MASSNFTGQGYGAVVTLDIDTTAGFATVAINNATIAAPNTTAHRIVLANFTADSILYTLEVRLSDEIYVAQSSMQTVKEGSRVG